MVVEHEGARGQATRTRIVFKNPKLPLQAVEVLRDADGAPELARVALVDGTELIGRYEEEGDARPSLLEGPDGNKAHISYKGAKAKVTFIAEDGKHVGNKIVNIPVELQSSLRSARLDLSGGSLWSDLSLIDSAYAADGDPAADEQVTVQRELRFELDITVAGGKAGTAQVDASCAPLTCLPVKAEVAVPGTREVRITVSGNSARAGLGTAGDGDFAAFKTEATGERNVASDVLPDAAAAVGAVGVAALACKAAKFDWPVCVQGLGKSAKLAGAAIISIRSHDVATTGAVIDKRARELFYEERARAALDKAARIEVCLGGDGYSRTCTTIEGRPLGKEAMPRTKRRIELRRGIEGALAGTFEMRQSDGADCKFSPSPKTSGPLRLSFDNARGVVTGTLKTNERGSRPNVRCSAGSANMSWEQTYSATVTQSFKPEQLQSGGTLPLRLTGTMKGNGSYSFSNCRSSGGISGSCPGGKRDTYAHPIEVIGDINLDAQTASGRIVVKNAPLSTSGTWRVPAK